MKGSLREKESVESQRAHSNEGWDPDWVVYSFTAWALCTNTKCKQEFALAGSGSVEQAYSADDDWDWVDSFTPLVCYPMPDIFLIPKKCPDDVAREIRASFASFWLHQGASAGRLRVALELLLNHIGIQKRRKAKKGGMTDLTLHSRIDIYSKQAPVTGAQLMALKWLGNTGSHDGSLSKHELLNAYEIFEHALGEIVEQRTERVAKLAKAMTKKHAKKKR